MTDDLRLEYFPFLSEDYLKEMGTLDPAYKAESPTLATLKRAGTVKELVVHFSNRIIVRRGTADVSRSFAVKRAWRNFDIQLDANDRELALDMYSLGPPGLGVDAGENKAVGMWKDAPYSRFAHRQTRYVRTLSEWVVAARRSYNNDLVEGLRGLYFFAVLDLTPTHYRYRLSASYELSIAETVDLFGEVQGFGPLPGNSPWKTEADVADAAWGARHQNWQSYAAINNQLPLAGP